MLTDAVKPTIKQAENVAGMGAIFHSKGVFFRVWAPHAQKLYVTGEFNNWSDSQHEMAPEENGYWGLNIEEAKAGQQYKFLIHTTDGILSKNDPYAKEVTNSVGNSIIVDPHFDWTDEDFKMPAWNELVIYEMHVGTFNVKDDGKPGTFDGVRERLSYLKALGINAIEIMPPIEFPGGYSWGYNPSHPFALESDYGGVQSFKQLVNAAHGQGIAIIMDIVYNHLGPGDLDLWQFDGWKENDGGGIYFYQDWRARTPWGDNRPDYGRTEVRHYIRDNALMWLDEYHVDGLRTDAIAYIRNVNGGDNPQEDLPDGWSLMKWVNEEVKRRFPWKITIAEDLRNNEWITKKEEEGGEGFSTQWDAAFVHPVRYALTATNDADRNMDEVCNAVSKYYNGDAFQRVIYTESHDEVANGKSRVPEEIAPNDSQCWFAKKRSILGAVLTFTSPGIPMIFQGQEMLEGGWFEDTRPLNWENYAEFRGIVKLYRDLIRLRTNTGGISKGLSGQHTKIIHINNEDKVIAFHRWSEGGPKDSVIIVLNFSDKAHENYNIGIPEEGLWKVRFNSETFESKKDGQEYNANVSLAPYNALILSRD
jgi:1,4-alpha-glucan branching enzyme